MVFHVLNVVAPHSLAAKRGSFVSKALGKDGVTGRVGAEAGDGEKEPVIFVCLLFCFLLIDLVCFVSCLYECLLVCVWCVCFCCCFGSVGMYCTTQQLKPPFQTL